MQMLKLMCKQQLLMAMLVQVLLLRMGQQRWLERMEWWVVLA
jgi:hypothetical protein